MAEKPSLTMRLFGPLDVRVDGQPLPHLRTHKVAWALALLVLRGGRAVERDWLAGTLWPDSATSQALYNLRQALSDLRGALGAHACRIATPGAHTVLLDLCDAEVDVLLFDEAVARGDPAALARAVTIYSGPLLEGCSEEWALPEREMREQAFLQALEALASHAASSGDAASAVTYARRAVAVDPLRESAWRLLMQSLASHGNYAEAAACYRRLRGLLRGEVQTEPSTETQAVYRRIREDARRAAPRLISAQPEHSAAPPHNLPVQVTSFVGREKEIAETRRLLAGTRLLTLTGSGGCGKTRLALQVAESLRPRHPHGVWLVPLAGLSDASLVAHTAARALGVRERSGTHVDEAIVDALHDRHILVVLDNCEHLLDGCAQLCGLLLNRCLSVQVLATSREPLGIDGETTFRVPSLSLPPPGAQLDAGEVSRYEGVRLFVERGAAAAPGFAISEQIAPAVLQVCRRLDGLPLAIEMAAARVRTLSVERMAERLDDGFGPLLTGSRTAPPRHRTLQATMDWSFRLLSVSEQLLLQRLSVFAGGWTIEAAERVCGEALPLLASLVDKSLVVFETDRERYRMLETVRQYASEGLAQCGEEEALRDRHLDYFVRLAEEAEDRFAGADGAAWMGRMDAERDDLRAALGWCVRAPDRAQSGLRLAAALCHDFWKGRGFGEESLWFERLMEHPGAGARTPARAKALWGSAALGAWGRGTATTDAMLEESLSIYREWGDKRGIGRTLSVMGCGAYFDADYPRARSLLEEGMTLLREVDDRASLAWTLNGLGDTAMCLGEYATADSHFEESLMIAGKMESPRYMATAMVHLALSAVVRGDASRGRRLIEETSELLGRSGHRLLVAQSLEVLVLADVLDGDYHRARLRLGETLALQQEIGDSVHQCWTFAYLGLVNRIEADYPAARACYAQSLELARELGITLKVGATVLEGVAGLATAEGQAKRAAVLWGAAAAIRKATGSPTYRNVRIDDARQEAAVRQALGEDAYLAAWAQGQTMTLEQAVAYALADGESAQDAGASIMDDRMLARECGSPARSHGVEVAG